jgi:hypothetical protein
VDGDAAYLRLQHLEEIYPGFREWYYGKVIPGVDAGERRLIPYAPEGEIMGIAIAKRGPEAKLCTLWVDPDVRLSRAGASLAERAFEWIGTTKPLFTVPAERLPEFRGLLRQWDFGAGQTVRGYYGRDRVEYVFNGALTPTVLS